MTYHNKQDKSSSGARAMIARAALINANRLAGKSAHQAALGQAAAKIENKMQKTSQALSLLGAGKSFGS